MSETRTVWLRTSTHQSFKTLFKAYFKEFGMTFPDDEFIRMDQDMKRFPMEIALLYLGEEAIGFCLFQIDTEDNPWCMHPGCGDIREFHISPAYRRTGYGRHLFQEVVKRFQDSNITEIYLTGDESGPFWQAIGFLPTGVIERKNNSMEYKYVIGQSSSR